MGRPSKIKPAIREVLSESDDPIRFSELKQKIEKHLNRNKIGDKQFNVNLQRLVKEGIVERILHDEKIAYRLTTGYFEQQLKSSLIKLINDRKLSQLYDRLEGEDLPPFIIFLDPPAYDYSTKQPITEQGEFDKYHSFGGGPMNVPGDVRIFPDWKDPSRSIASVMLNDFWGLYSVREQEKVTTLIRWAYWLGCRDYIENNSILNLKKSLDENRKFAIKCIEKFSNDKKRIEAEKALLSILEMTDTLIEKKNLAEFLKYIYENRRDYERLLNKIISLENSLGGGERLFSTFFDFSSKISSGFAEAGLFKANLPMHRMPIKERFFLTTGEVWNEFFGELLYDFEYHFDGVNSNSELLQIQGSLDEATERVTGLKDYLKILLELQFKRKMVLVYLWGFPESIQLSSKSVIRTFDHWLEALKVGRLDHRNWLFSDKTLDRLESAYRAVKRNSEPLNIRIDKEQWSLKDLYLYHPFGKDIGFWDTLINEIKNRADMKREIYRGGPVPKDVYEIFNRKETEFIEKMLNEEEADSKKRRK